MKRLAYNLALHCLAAPLLFSYFAPQILLKGRYRHSIKGKLGFLPTNITPKSPGRIRIWFHAVSVGEVVALAPLVEKTKLIIPQLDPLISTGTETGQKRATELIKSSENFFYMPLDFPYCVKRAVDIIKPDVFVMTETEIWPNLIHELKAAGARIALMNGRISDRSYPRYVKLKRFFKDTLDSIDLFSMCSDEDALRIVEMGADPYKIKVSGNIKIDSAFKTPDRGIETSLRKLYQLEESEDVLLAGSIHPGEDSIIINSYKELIKKFPHLVLVIAPRHLEKMDSIISAIHKAGLQTPMLKSELDDGVKRNRNNIILIDQMGELFNAYSIASVVFVGGSLVSKGGQNIIEPASWAKPVIFGPSMEDFRDSSEILLRNEAAFRINDVNQLIERVDLLLSDSDVAHKMGNIARNVLSAHVGSAEKSSEMLAELAGLTISSERN
ncbi:MAG: 3-deoxy-D-manno-octulosonic acid transferase [Desulfomonilaceae bacterium]